MSKENNNGNFEYALERLLADLVKGELSNASMLSRFDYARGNDWHITKYESDVLNDRIIHVEDISKVLWCLLDDVDTFGDMYKPEHTPYFRAVNKKICERHRYIRSDGYNLDIIDSNHPNGEAR